MTDEAALDLCGKYFWTRLAGDHAALSSGEAIQFGDADSSRLRAGARFSWPASDRFKPCLGAVYEHEFGGRARASTSGFPLAVFVGWRHGRADNWLRGVAGQLGACTGVERAGLRRPTRGLTGSFQLKFGF
jgi:hypothetical protein